MQALGSISAIEVMNNVFQLIGLITMQKHIHIYVFMDAEVHYGTYRTLVEYIFLLLLCQNSISLNTSGLLLL